MNKYRKLVAIFLCLLLISGCAPRTRKISPPQGIQKPHVPPPHAGVGDVNLDKMISTIYERIDMSIGKVATQNAEIKSGPGDSFSTLGKVKTGDQLNVYGKTDGWYIVKVPNATSIGCIKESQLKPFFENMGTKKIPNVPSLIINGQAVTPGVPHDPGTQGTPNVPGQPAIPGTPDNPGSPTSPGTPTVPEIPRTPSASKDKPRGDATTEDSVGTGVMTAEEKKVFDLCNSERTKIGAPALKASNDLTKLARLKAKDLVDNNYFSHQSPTYGSPFDMMRDFGINYMYAGENLAQNSTADRAHNAWMGSEGHRKNILNPNFTELGVGIAPKGDGSFIYTQMFIGK